MKQKFIDMYMSIAKTVSEQSSAKRLKVGAIIVKDDRIISIGYNGMPSGWTNDCEFKHYVYGNLPSDPWLFREEDSKNFYILKTKPEVIHAEANAIAKLAKCTESGDGSTMFLTHAPCIHCAKQIYTAGINKVYFGKHYRDTEGVDFLKNCKLEIEEWNIGENT